MPLETLIRPLTQLLEKGSCLAISEDLNQLLPGLAHPCANGKNWVISQRLLQVRQQLNSDQELVAAILATNEQLRTAWCQIMAARCHEAGTLADKQVLIRSVSQLNGAAAWVAACLEHKRAPTLQPTEYVALERNLLGAGVEQNQTTPALVRVLAAASLINQWQQQPLSTIDAVDMLGGRPDINWCRGRLIQQPGHKASEFQYLLSGASAQPLATQLNQLSEKDQNLAVMEWVLANPWAYLLSLILYEQNIWEVEAAGGLLLELPAGQSPQNPSEIQVLVAGSDGDELLCGHLGEFVCKILSSLNMGIFPAGLTSDELNSGLANVISQLLNLKVWRYVEGLSGEQGYYRIHPDFSDACFGRKGQPSFSRYARPLRQAIRSQAVQWRNDRSSLGGKLVDTMDASAA
ncbi:hypothetical protein [Motilimonas eburnea]|uniref:hypothetical protein n=1 Tax=Motilimonas eburnea TaxID=1737488 RepID=UPI001E536F8A|nr:hypothetical protein [Motilimonas eburnea]MCE2570544.1 hypothetical protein [Motilimonas eburnea]